MVSESADLRIYCWEGYDSAAILNPFRRRHGIKIKAKSLISDKSAAQLVCDQSSELRFDVLNINNAWVQKLLYPRGVVRALSNRLSEVGVDQMLPGLAHLDRWSWSADGCDKIGICQRFGTFNLVINTEQISEKLAKDEGFKLAADPGLHGRYGILLYEDFNLFHICIAADLNPFAALSIQQEEEFERTAHAWFQNAAIVTDDHHQLNQTLIEKRIDFYLSGGVYTASPARLNGNKQVTAITPTHGPIDGRGGIVFTEVTCTLAHPYQSPWAEPFLEYLLEPDTSIHVAFLDGTCNPVLQMGDPKVMSAFSKTQLSAIQWDTLEEDISQCVDYDIVPNAASLLRRLDNVRKTIPPNIENHPPNSWHKPSIGEFNS